MTTSPPDKPESSAPGKKTDSATTTAKRPEINPVNQPVASAPVMACGAAIGTGEMERFVKAFQQSTQRWEIVVYPALFAFTVLASYGFFLIYSLTGNMSTIARSMDPRMGEHMQLMSDNIGNLNKQIIIMTHTVQEVSQKLDALSPMLQHMAKMETSITDHLPAMSQNIGNMQKAINSLPPMLLHMDNMDRAIGSLPEMLESMGSIQNSIERMDKTMHVMANSTSKMQVELMVLNQSVSRPMSFVNSFAPW